MRSLLLIIVVFFIGTRIVEQSADANTKANPMLFYFFFSFRKYIYAKLLDIFLSTTSIHLCDYYTSTLIKMVCLNIS